MENVVDLRDWKQGGGEGGRGGEGLASHCSQILSDNHVETTAGNNKDDSCNI